MVEEVNMRGISLLLAAAVIGSCATASSPPPVRSVQGQQDFARLTAGKIAQPPVACLPTYNTNDQTIIDEQTIAYRVGANRIYIAHMQDGGCTGLGRGNYTLVTKTFGGTGLCRGDIAQIADIPNHITVGSCVFGDFTPYVKP
jgi:hypothetical protein